MLALLSVLSIFGLLAWGLHLYYRVGQLDRRIAKQHKLHDKLER